MTWFKILKYNDEFWQVEDVQKIKGLIRAYYEGIPWTKRESIFNNMGHLIDRILVYGNESTIKIYAKRGEGNIAHLQEHAKNLQQSLLNDLGATWTIMIDGGN